jgi:hypothetical protein
MVINDIQVDLKKFTTNTFKEKFILQKINKIQSLQTFY